VLGAYSPLLSVPVIGWSIVLSSAMCSPRAFRRPP
jgi:hypothetical protein